MILAGGRPKASAQPEQKLAGYTNYLFDRDPHKWRTHVPNYGRVRYYNVYPGIDVVYYGDPRELEFDFILAPGADPRRIEIALSNPDLQIRLPRIYQGDHAVNGRAVRHGNRVTFELAAYDHSKRLVIDPVLSYASIFGGGGQDEGRAIAVDSTGAVYVAGNASDSNFPAINSQPGRSSFVVKLNPSGSAIVFATYLPYAGGQLSYAVDASGHVYVTTPGFLGFPEIDSGSLIQCRTIFPDVYVAKLSTDGASLVYGGCIGGGQADIPTAIAVDANGDAYVTGQTQSPDFPLVNPLQSSYPDRSYFNEGFVLKLGPDGTLLYSTYLGGGSDFPRLIASDPARNAYVAGSTQSPDFPLKNAIKSQFDGSNSAFIAKISADGSSLVYSTYFGGASSDQVNAIAADASGNTYVGGATVSANFPTTANSFQSKFNGISAFKTMDGGANWSRSDSGLPGATSSVTVDPRNPSNVYAISANRVFKSTDRGATWRATSAARVSAVWIDPVDSTVFAGTLEGNTGATDLLRSRDGGATFTDIDAGRYGFINQMVFDPKNASVMYLRWGGTGSGDGLYKSADGGDTWSATAISGPGTGSGGVAVDPAHPSTLYISTHKGLLRSDDAGGTFSTVNANITATQLLIDSASTLYAVTFGQTNGSVLIQSGDTFVSKALPGASGTLLIDPANNSTWYLVSFAPTSGAGIYKTTDAGDTWQLVSNGLPDAKTTGSLALDPGTPATLYLGAAPASDGFFAELSPDGASLKYSTYFGGFGTDSAAAIAVDTAGNAYIAGTTSSKAFPTQAPFRDSGTGFLAKFDATNALQWSSFLGDAAPVAMALGPAGEVYLTGSSGSAAFPTPNGIGPFVSGSVFGTSDGGTTWTNASLPNTFSAPTALPFAPILAADPQMPSRVYALADHLYVTDDGGQDWTQLGTPPTAGFGPLFRVALIIDPVNPTTMYSTGAPPPVTAGASGGGIYKSTDGGLTWTFKRIVPSITDPPSFGGPAVVEGLSIDPRTPTTLYAALANGGIYKSTDGAATWTFSGPPSATSAVAVAVDLLNPGILYASDVALGPPSPTSPFKMSLDKSVDGGATWSAINNGLPSRWLATLLVPDRAVPGRVYATQSSLNPIPILPPADLLTNSYGIYRSDDGGNDWRLIGSGLPNSPITALEVDPSNSSIVYAAPLYGSLYRSTDAGENFKLIPGMQVPIVSSIAIDPFQPSNVYAGSVINPNDAFVMKVVQ
jgi:photosystem II stability/assembly factor-like uncharacterized protein